MVIQKVRRVGNSFVVTIPKEEMERQGLGEGDEVALEVRKVVTRPQMSPAVRAAFEQSLETYAADYEYLKDR